MKITKSEAIRPFDVDGTLILPLTAETDHMPKIEVYDAITKTFIEMRIHEPMVRILEEEYHRGGYIIVWSRSGWEWAKNVVIALELQDKVHRVMSKPLVYFDDMPIDLWLKDRVFLDPNTPYKK